MDFRRLIGGLSFLFVVTGLLLICLVPGGLYVVGDLGLRYCFDRPLHIVGFSFLGVGAVGFVVLLSLKNPRL